MLPVSLELIKDFEVEAQKYLESKEGLILFVKGKYKTYGIEFHNIFLKSNILIEMGIEFLEKLLYELKNVDLKDWKRISLDIYFIVYVMKWRKKYKDMCKEVINKFSKKLVIEDLFTYFEYLNSQVLSKKKIFGQEYIEGISESQLSHIHDTFDEIINIINEFEVEFSCSIPTKINKNCEEIFEIVSHIKAVQDYFEEVIDRAYNPVLTTDYWFLARTVKYWSKMEKYRDLNVMFQAEKDNTVEEIENIMKETGALSIYGKNEVWKLDASESENFDSTLKIHQAYKLLYPMYGERDTIFTYNKKDYKISDVLELYKELYNFTLRIFGDEENNSKKGYILLIGRKRLLRKLNIEYSTFGDLLDLLSFDFINDDKNVFRFKPLLKRGELFFVLPSRITEMTMERVIDKILSSDRISVNFKEGKGSSWKGFAFENSVENFIKSKKIQFGKVAKNDKRGIPEIDGMFVIDNYVFIYEAKAFIKPENVVEAYDRLRDILYDKAKQQLDIRLDKIINESESRQYIEDKIGFTLKNKNIAPFILVSNSFFCGYRELKNSLQGLHYPIVHFNDLKSVLTEWKIPIWNYNKGRNEYIKSNKKIQSGKDLWDFMLNQFDNLQTIEKPTIVCGNERIAYQIVKPMTIYDEITKI